MDRDSCSPNPLVLGSWDKCRVDLMLSFGCLGGFDLLSGMDTRALPGVFDLYGMVNGRYGWVPGTAGEYRMISCVIYPMVSWHPEHSTGWLLYPIKAEQGDIPTGF
ncbi:466c04b0-c9af-4433-ac47-a28b969322b7-CDS [Sclerotinia trifoliorum]|uniref:466c04b0-c9af-4433-ac47-a28b969322b7-CDS n=1 Tax=Sclerotinia trifoliorum TaxID=28548 RepID=A0A8H2VLJ1_9HELO|nr:466c04b0-c9af-4433-ac47-a28b969322b7-CDS [Sclerotinia trifoliorum]